MPLRKPQILDRGATSGPGSNGESGWNEWEFGETAIAPLGLLGSNGIQD